MCVDERMSPWKERKKGIKVFVKGKPHSNGIKIYLLADSTNFVYDFWIYRGTQPFMMEIVSNFVDSLPGKGYCIVADAYYGRLQTAKQLLQTDQYFLFSCKANHLFSDFLHPGLDQARGAVKWASWKRKILAVSWRDKKPINILTN